jgi:hypothetical protein
MNILQTAPRAPRMNAHCERVIRPLRHEFCDHVLILNDTHARQLLATYCNHYNDHRPHQARSQLPPGSDRQPATVHDLQARRLRRTHILGGMINEHRYTARAATMTFRAVHHTSDFRRWRLAAPVVGKPQPALCTCPAPAGDVPTTSPRPREGVPGGRSRAAPRFGHRRHLRHLDGRSSSAARPAAACFPSRTGGQSLSGFPPSAAACSVRPPFRTILYWAQATPPFLVT